MAESTGDQGESQSQLLPGPEETKSDSAAGAAPIASAEDSELPLIPPPLMAHASEIPSPAIDQPDPVPVSVTSGGVNQTSHSKSDVIPPPVVSASPLQSFPPNPGDTTTTTKDDTQVPAVPKPAAPPAKITSPVISKASQSSSEATSDETPPANQPSLTPQQTRALQQQQEITSTAQTTVSTQMATGPPANVSAAPTQPSKSKTPDPPEPKPTSLKERPKSQDVPKLTSTPQFPQAPKEMTVPPKNSQTSEASSEDLAAPQKAEPSPTKRASGNNATTSSQRELTLYLSYGSYYSQKVLLALYEKDLTFTPHVIRLDKNEQLDPWFISINPKAEVPVLKAGDKYITESEVIINYIGRLPISAGNSLVGDSRTASGQTVQRFRRLLDGVNIPLLTYGLVNHPHQSKGTIKIPGFRQQLMKEQSSGKLTVLSRLAETYPEHRASYLALSETHAQKYETFTDLEALKRELEQLGKVLRKVEEQLTKSQDSEDSTASGSWLCGSDFTAADITLLVLLTRLHLLGLDTDYLQDDMPSLCSYYRRAVNRPSYQRLLKDSPGASSALLPFLWYNSKKALPYVGGVTAVGAVAGVAYWLYKKVS